jgi:iron complex outermembrane receptor protein
MSMKTLRPCSRTSLAALALGLSLFAAPAQAKDDDATAAPESEGIGDIVVTAQRREQSLQKVPIAVAALEGEALRDMGMTRSTDIVRLTPGVSISSSSAGESAQYTMRGVTQNDYAEIAEGPIAVYVDDSYIPNLQGANFGFYDMERVEVLKGPQGILFGRNATGGLVHYIIAKPSDRLEGYGEATYGSYDQMRFEGAISGPLGETLSARASFLFDRNGAFWKNVYPGGLPAGVDAGPAPDPCCSDLGQKRQIAGRLQLEWKPDDALSVRLMGSLNRQRNSSGAYGQIGSRAVLDGAGRVIDTVFAPTDAFGFVAPDIDDRQISVDLAKKNSNFSYSNDVNLHIDYDLGGVDLVSITSYRKFWKSLVFDADASPINFLNFGSKGNATNWSQELRLQGSSDTLNWTTGLFLLDIDSHFNVGLLGPVGSLYAGLFGAAGTGIDTVNDARLRSKSASVFGQVEWKFAPTLTVIAGLRGIHEKQKYRYGAFAYADSGAYDVTTDPDFFLYSFDADYSDSRSSTMWSGKLQLQWDPSDDAMLYAGINRGVKGGNYNVLLAGSTIDTASLPYGAETLVAYEVGAKLTFWDGKARLNASAYYYDYKNYQAYSSRGLTTFVLNKPAENYGAELALTLKPVPELTIDLSGSALSAKVKNVSISAGLPEQTVETPFAPKRQAAAQVSYAVPGAVAGGELTLAANYYYTSGFFANNQNFTSQYVPGYSLVGANVRWEDASRHWNVTLTANNIFDKRYGTTLIDLTGVCGCTEAAYGTPRWLTAAVGYRF